MNLTAETLISLVIALITLFGILGSVGCNFQVFSDLTHVVEKTNPAYVATRKQLLSRGNPYYAQGDGFFGIGQAIL